MRILTLVPGGIGDQILFFPTLETLKQQYPQAAIDVIVEPLAKGAYRVCQSIHEVLSFEFRGSNGLADYLNLLGIIRDNEYDIVITAEQSWVIDLLLWLNGIPLRIGYTTNRLSFLSNSVPLKTEQYIAQMYHDLVRGLGINTPCPSLKINVPKPDIDWAEMEQQYLGIKGNYILIHGGASQILQSQGIDKIYPVRKWQRVIEDIQRRQPDLPIVLLQGPEDQEWSAELKALCPTVKIIIPPDIGKLAAIIAGANLILCTDAAPMRLALAVGTYTIALFGPTEPKKSLSPDNDRCVPIQSLSGKIADIQTEQILEQVWR